MKKITLLLLMSLMAFVTNAQITLTPVKTDGFETTDGWPSSFSRTNSQAFSTATPPYTGLYWNNFFVTMTGTKDDVSTIQSVGAYSGSQCLKIAVGPTEATTATVLKLRTVANMLTLSGDYTKYVISFYAKTDIATTGKKLVENGSINLTDSWQKVYVTSNYSTNASGNILQIDLAKATSTDAAPAAGYAVYLDEFKVEETPIPSASAATDITTNSFSANWPSVSGATNYKLLVEEDISGNGTWTAVPTYPLLTGNVTTYSILGLTSSRAYRYKVAAKDANVLTQYSSLISVTTSIPTNIDEMQVAKTYAANGVIYTTATAGSKIQITNALGQTIKAVSAVDGVNIVQLQTKGVVFVKVGSSVTKLVIK